MQNEERDLKERTKQFARRIIRMYVALPKETVAQVLGKQVLRSGSSKPEFIAKVGDCLREADETEYWLELLVDEGFVTQQKMNDLLDETRQLMAIFVTILKRAKGQ